MKVVLLEVKSKKKGFINKDTSGGLGTVSDFGSAPVPKLLTLFKKFAISYPVLAMGYVASILLKNGHSLETALNEVPKDAELVIVYGSIVDYKAEIMMAEKVRSQTNSKVCFIGPFVSIKPELFLPHCDFLVKGEPETFFLNLKCTDVLPDGVVESPVVDDLDSLPFPAWQVFPSKSFKYKPYFLISGRGKFFPILSSRGCTFSCAYYCPYPTLAGRKWRYRSPQNVVDEIEFLTKEHNATFLLFRDPIFTVNRSRAIALAEEIIKRRIKVKYVCETHLDRLDREMLNVLYESGLRAIKVGVESANSEVLDSSQRKPTNIEHQEEILSFCDKKGISVTAFYILGYPSDTIESIKQTVQFATKLNTVGAQFTICTPYPGTKFFNELREGDKLLTEDYEQYNIQTLVYQHGSISPEELLTWKNYAYQRYYLRWNWFKKMLRQKVFST